MPREGGASSNRRRRWLNRDAAAYWIVAFADDDKKRNKKGRNYSYLHCEEQSDEAIQSARVALDCFASLAMTKRRKAGIAPGLLILVVDGRVKSGHDDVGLP